MYLVEMYAREKYIKMYLDYTNNFLTVEKFAEHYQITIEEAQKSIEKGKQAHYKGSGVLGNDPSL
jgi:hypothetical protein